MKISFVIPAHNEEAYLGKCLDSVLRERAKGKYNLEIIVVNNASTDRTRQVAEEFDGVRIVDEPKKGLPQARQAGFLVSTGELIANLDADTILPGDWIDKALGEFKKDSRLVALSGPFYYYDLPHLTNSLVQAFYGLGSLVNSAGRMIFRSGGVIQGGNFVLRRSALEQIGGYNLEIEFLGEDGDVARRIGKVGKVKFTSDFPINSSGRRIRSEGIVTNGVITSLNYVWIMLRKKPFKKHYPSSKRKK
ncbi:glycosyltransferase family 2 protein [bacterium]|nr:MAG: glycosyltransferase family 2 protein [bacterium]